MEDETMMDTITDLRKQGYDWDNISRTFRVLLDRAGEMHPEWYSEDHQDSMPPVPDCPCAHMNEAEYVLAVIDSHIETGAYHRERNPSLTGAAFEPVIGSRYIDGDGETWEVGPNGTDTQIKARPDTAEETYRLDSGRWGALEG